MQIIQDAWRAGDVPTGCVATIGKLDGVHLGQRAVIERVVEHARREGVPAVAISFEPHPARVLAPESAPPLLTPGTMREEQLAETGLDALLLLRFTRELAATSPDEFVYELLVRKLAVRAVYVGRGFTFGHRRKGNVRRLRELGEEHGFEAVAVDEEVLRGEIISATRIRRAIHEGDTEFAMEMLGRPYALRGKVARGDRMGAKLGWPTVNLDPEGELLPCDGVYAGRILVGEFPDPFNGVINVGTRPTVYESYQRVVESHIFDFAADVYGEPIEVRFYKRLRSEKMFPTVMDLSAQISRDAEAAREYFAARRC